MTPSVKEFYDRIQFPGAYTMEQLSAYETPIANPYLRIIDEQISSGQTILDVGCGTGLVTNLLGLRHPTSRFTGIDFSQSIMVGRSFSYSHNLDNVCFLQQDVFDLDFKNYFDVVICQGVLHHIPNYHKALEILVNFVKPGGTLILGLYHPAGKIMKKIFQVDYGNDVLFQDQELNPFEISLTLDQIKESLEEFTLCRAYPRYLNNYWIPSFLNYKNGGLVTYVLQKSG